MFYQIMLPLGIPSKKNSKRIFKNRSTGKLFITASSAYKAWQAKTKPLMERQKLLMIEPITSPFIDCSITIYINDTGKKSYDLSNKAESILDCLVDAGVLADDNRFCVRNIFLIGRMDDKQDQRVVVTIKGETEGEAQ